MVTSFTCICGNTDPKKVREYHGALGYEALICRCCGRYYDTEGNHDADDFSKPYIDAEYSESDIEDIYFAFIKKKGLTTEWSVFFDEWQERKKV
jgi:hypothetical protein